MARNSRDRFKLSPASSAKFTAFARLMARQSAREATNGPAIFPTGTSLANQSWVLGTSTAT